MSNIHRYFTPGNMVFITSVTHQRIHYLVQHSDLLTSALRRYSETDNIELIAWVILPDHFHLLIGSPEGNVPIFIKRLKQSFSTNLRKRLNLYRGKTWQERYWDHIIRDENDLQKHFDYIHYNPVKHGLATDPQEYSLSTFKYYKDKGFYTPGWGVKEKIEFDGNYGE